MRKVSACKADRVWYQPDVFGNREDPEPFAVELSPISGAEMMRLEQDMGALSRAKPNFVERAQRLADSVISRHVHGVRGYSVGDVTPVNGASLLKAVALAGASEWILIEDILEALKDMSKLEAGLSDRSGSQSA